MSPREIFSFDSSPEKPEIIAVRQENFRSERKLPDERWSLPEKEFEALLDEINFPLLFSTLENLGEKCGVSREEINICRREDIFQFDSAMNQACYLPEGNVICLQGKKILEGIQLIVEEFSEEAPSPEALRKIYSIHILIHEEVHAISATKLENWNELMAKRDLFRLRNASPGMYTGLNSGYQNRTYSLESPTSDYVESTAEFAAFDEGVTEALAFDLLVEYMSQDDSISTEDMRKYIELVEIHGEKVNPYHRLVELVKRVAAKIADESGIDRQTVWQGIIRSKLEGIDLKDTEFIAAMDAHAYGGFVEELRNLDFYPEEITSCVQKLELVERN